MQRTKLSGEQKDEIICRLKELFPTNNPASWSKCTNTQLLDWYKSYCIVTTIDQLKNICLMSDTGANFALMLNGGLRSSKHIQYDKNEKIFFVLNEIDGSEQKLNDKQIMDKEYTNIGEGINKKALIFDYLN